MRSAWLLSSLLLLAPSAWGQGAPEPPAPSDGPPPSGQPVDRPAPEGQPPADQPETHAGESGGACFESFAESQRRRKKSQLVAARAELVACGHQSCPDVVRAKCVQWLEEVQRAIPTVVVSARRGDRDMLDAALAIDGMQIASSLDGKPIELDPGPHSVTVTIGGDRVEQRIVLVQGEKNRRLLLTFPVRKAAPKPRPKPAPPEKPSFRMPVLAWVGYGVGAVGVVVGAVTGSLAISRAELLDDTCDNNQCHPLEKPDYEEGLALAHTSTVAFSIAGAGIAAGTIGLFLAGPSKAGDHPVRTSLSLGPGWMGVSGRFW